MKTLTISTAIVLATALSALAGPAKPDHPYILWTPQEAKELKKLYESNEWARRVFAEMAKERKGETYVNLFRYQILGDEKAGQRERKYLLSFIDAPIRRRDASGHSVGRHYDNYEHALRYDVLYDTLTPDQRKKIEDTFRKFINYELEHPYRNTRLSLLPNMQLPRMFAAHLMSVALGDEQLIRKLWAAPSGYKWYFNAYLSDGGFYNEEFGKMTSLIGEMLLYSRGMDRLGLNDLGYGFTGPQGANMRNYVESLIWIGYPRTEIPGGTPRYERIAMGDARGSKLGVFQHANVQGHLPGDADMKGFGGWQYFYGANMNGRDHRGRKVGKLQLPQWFEILHARYPDGPFGYFLAQMHEPGKDAWYPTPFWGLKPLKASDVKPPKAPSAVWPERGFAMLRADESGKYWESPAPAVALQFATLYVHYTPDCFSLLGYHAFNRPIYVNRTISAGYNGGPWDFSVRGHCGVVVDGEQAQPIGMVPSRSDFSDEVKFVSARGKLAKGADPYKGRGEVRSSDQPREPFTDVYSNIDLSRSLFLTDEYLFDVYWLADEDGKDRDFHWLVHAPGVLAGDGKWADSDTIQKTLMNVKPTVTQKRNWLKCEDPKDSWILIDNEKKRDVGDGPVDVRLVQKYVGEDISDSVLGKKWYDRKIGVRVRMLGEKGTGLYSFDTPTSYRPGTPRGPRGGEMRPQHETGGVSLAVHRRAPKTIFVALHEPFENATSRIDGFRRIAQTDDATAVTVTGSKAGVNDRLMVRIGDNADKAITLSGDGESFTFTGHAFVRIGEKGVAVRGNLSEMKLKVTGSPKLTVNGRDVKATISDGVMTWKK
ncbi:MAG: hypothetical protein ACLFVU_07845 [Phycisphaerae bacterium]